ncbi:MipA/OmpV family protein [Marinospirillum perlucidum]|uniref:MipA/OmpV family protein n=1 Tax=Marinospirillum perlucidum TaxID=1982602 RepID=UPI0013902856|nr:MipA/OmpV family protein [Marinospirillum perlucidum]
MLIASLPAAANWSAGVGGALGQSPYRGVSTNPNTIPAFVSYRGRFAYLRGIEAGINAWGTGGEWGGVQASVLVKGRLAGYESSDSWYLHGMEDRDWSIDGGVGFSGRVNGHQFSVQLITDLLDKHQGQEIGTSYSYGFKITPKLRMSPGVSLSWQSSDLLSYYYGVRAEEADASRERWAYQADAAWVPSLNLNTIYSFNQSHSIMLVASSTRLPDEVTASPLVSREWVSGGFFAYLYRF